MFTLLAEGYDDRQLSESVLAILEATELCSMATIQETRPYISTAYFAYADDLTIYFLSNPIRQHSLNLTLNSAISLTVFDTSQPFASLAQGLQIFGDCQLTQGNTAGKAFDIYTKRFPKLLNEVPDFNQYANGAIASRLYEVKCDSIKDLR
jgi:uncharacterized protein YhbP (UPF0306 family)